MRKVPFKEAFLFWLKLGFISFGGPAGQIAIMHQQLVEKRKWISESKFLHALNYCMLLPGPEAQQLAVYTGWLMHGTIGGLMAGLLFILPSLFILLALSIIYTVFGKQEIVYSMFWGLKPAVAAIVFIALWKIADRALKKWIDYVVALFSVVALLIFNMPYPLVIVSAIMIGWVYVWFNNRKASNEANTAIIHIDETAYCINGRSGLPHTKFSGKKLAVQLIIAIVAWALPMVFFYFFSRDFLFWKQLSVFFTKAALLSFGGAYSVLVYVAQISVNNLHWLTQPQMVDGLALGETTPGPLIMVLAFVGFMGSYHHFNSLALASVGLIVTTYFTFLPSFVFVLAGAPIIEHTHENRQLKLVLGFVTSAVVGVIANLTIFTTKAILFSGTPTLKSVSWPVLFWIIISVVAMKRFNTNMVAWIMVSAVYGLLIHFLL